MSMWESIALYSGLITYVLIAATVLHFLWAWVKAEITDDGAW